MCFVRSRSGRSRADQESSRSSPRYSASCVGAIVPTEFHGPAASPISEGIGDDLQPAGSIRHDVEAQLELAGLRVRREPRLGRLTKTTHLLRSDHLQWVAPFRAGLGFHFAEDDRAAAPQDEVELVASDPTVRSEYPVAAKAVVPQRAALGARPDRARVRPLLRAGLRLLLHSGSRAPGTTGDGCGTAHARGRGASGAA